MKWKWRHEDSWDEGSIDAMPLSEAFDLFFLIHVKRACDLQSVKEKLVSTTSGCSEPHFFQDTRDLDQIYDWLSAHKLPEVHWDHMRPPSLYSTCIQTCDLARQVCAFFSRALSVSVNCTAVGSPVAALYPGSIGLWEGWTFMKLWYSSIAFG